MNENIIIDKKSLKFLRGSHTDWYELIYKDVMAYPKSGFGEIHQRIGEEINKHKVRRIIRQMLDKKILIADGVNKWKKYSIEQNLLENDQNSIKNAQ